MCRWRKCCRYREDELIDCDQLSVQKMGENEEGLMSRLELVSEDKVDDVVELEI